MRGCEGLSGGLGEILCVRRSVCLREELRGELGVLW